MCIQKVCIQTCHRKFKCCSYREIGNNFHYYYLYVNCKQEVGRKQAVKKVENVVKLCIFHNDSLFRLDYLGFIKQNDEVGKFRKKTSMNFMTY